MKHFLLIAIVLLLLSAGAFVFFRQREQLFVVSRVEMGSDIRTVARMLYHERSQTLFLAVREQTNERAVWKRDAYGKTERVLAYNALEGDIFLAQSRRGTLFAWFNNPAQLYRSEDHGGTWQSAAEGLVFWTISEGDDGTLYGPLWEFNAATLYRSKDDGKTWELWKDFQKLFPEYAVPYAEGDARFKLRHLHDVVVRGQTILVGAGDVVRRTFRLEDNGETWQEIWTEGPTAHTFLSDTTVLLGPDKAKGRGLALYDFTTKKLEEVWNPSTYGYASYTYSMITVDGVAYVALHNESNAHADLRPRYGVIASLDGRTWYPLITRGPVANTGYTSVYLAANGEHIYASIDGMLYVFKSISKESLSKHTPL